MFRHEEHCSASHEYLADKVLRFVYSFLASCDYCRLQITFAISLEPDQDPQNVGLDLNPKRVIP